MLWLIRKKSTWNAKNERSLFFVLAYTTHAANATRRKGYELLEIIKIKDYIKKHTLKEILEKYGNFILLSIFRSRKYFANALFKEVELQFIRLYITTQIGELRLPIAGSTLIL